MMHGPTHIKRAHLCTDENYMTRDRVLHYNEYGTVATRYSTRDRHRNIIILQIVVTAV